ncbi:hypothetical protein BDN72DRAFT_201131 [Pluteus cervinus]|uniref:Uncharacterized protein n=1 Tax=Pluteus cervinus TaxID=181527 RepID=A0ACD3B6Y6_9AGAR|nr:hypothetical protein BDN72DRAFT_201131 [Pluteus cervinus]
MLRLVDAILLRIFDELVEKDLNVLLWYSCRLHDLAVRSLLQRMGVRLGVQDLEFDLSIGGTPNVLLRTFLLLREVPSTRSLSFKIHHIVLDKFFVDFRGICRLYSRTPAVESVLLTFKSGLLDFELKEISSSDESRRWKKEKEALLDMLEKRGCQSLSIHHHGLFRREYRSTVAKYASGSRFRPSVLRGSRLWSSPAENPSSKLILTHLTIESSRFFGDEFYAGALAFFRKNRITSLTIDSISLPGLKWPTVLADLRRVVEGTLTELDIQASQIPPDNLLIFLAKLTNLTHIKLMPSLRLFPPFTPPKIPKLRQLTAISCSPEYLNLLLPACLTTLITIDVSLPNFTHIQSTSITDTLISIVNQLSLHRVHITLTVQLDMGQITSMVRRTLNALLSSGPEWDQAYSFFKIIRLALVSSCQSGPLRNDLLLLCRWLGIFPALESITFLNGGHIGETPMISAFIRTICRRYSNIRIVTIDQQVFRAEGIPPLITSVVVSQPRVTKTTFVDLPDDILRLIFHYLSTELYSLSMLSKRLHFIALPVFLEHHGITDPIAESRFTLDKTASCINAFSALRLAVFITSIDHLHCRFPVVPDLYLMFDQMYQLRDFVARLTRVRTVCLDFGPKYLHCKANDPLLERWVSCLGGLLETIVSRGCISLTLRGYGHFMGSYTLLPQEVQPAIIPRDLQEVAMSGKTWQFQRVAELGSKNIFITRTIRSNSETNLGTLVIASESFLRPPGLPWTILILKQSPITCLEILDIPKNLSFILSQLAGTVPRLERLTISGEADCFDVFKFISHAPLLSSLTLDRSLRFDLKPHRATIPKLCSLVELLAPPEYIINILSDQRLVNLKKVGIAIYDLFNRQFEYWLSSAGHIQTIFRLFHAWDLDPEPELCLDILSSHSPWMSHDFGKISATDPDWVDSMKSLKRIVFRNYEIVQLDEGQLADNNYALPRWLKLFPSLAHVSLLHNANFDIDSFRRIAKSIVNACPQLLTFEVNGEDLRPMML